MKDIKVIIVLFFLSIGLIFCNNKDVNNAEFVRQKIGNSFKFPENSEIIYADNYIYDSLDVYNAKVKIVTYINFNCSYCYKEIDDYLSLIHNYDIKQVSLIIYGKTNNLSGIYSYIENSPNFKYPIFYDKEGSYFNLNNIPIEKKVLHTFLLNDKNKICLVGNPFVNKNINILYRKEITKLLNE